MSAHEVIDTIMKDVANDAIYVAKLHAVSEVVNHIFAYAAENNIERDPFEMLDAIFADKENMLLVPMFSIAMSEFTRAREKREAQLGKYQER